MSLDYAILGFLGEGEQSGYDLKTRCFDEQARHFWTADQSQVYRTLERLERARLVRSRFIPQRGKPGRKVFSLTQQGKEQLSQWLSSPHDPPASRDPFLLQLYFAAEIPDEAFLAVLEEVRGEQQRRLDDLRGSLSRHLKGRRSPTRRDEFARLSLEASISAARAGIDWIDDCIEILRSELESEQSGAKTQRRLFHVEESEGGASR